MKILGSLNDTGQDFQRPESGMGRHSMATVVVVSSLILVTILVVGYFVFFRPSRQQHEAQSIPAPISTEAQVLEDEIILKDNYAVIGGKVRNISRSRLKGLSLEFELKRRDNGSMTTRTIAIEPDNLASGEEGKFSFNLPRQEYSGTQLKHLKSDARADYVAFKTAPGARRPRELPTEPPVRTIITERPAPRKSGDDFINTPDTPTRVP